MLKKTQENRWFVSASQNGNYLDERFFITYHQALYFAAGIATVLGSVGTPDGQVVIVDRRRKKTKELFIMDSRGETADITDELRSLIDRKFRPKSKKEENENGTSLLKLN
ncbi:MAG: hypothetical protein WCR67_05870 [Bacilli bacterium]